MIDLILVGGERESKSSLLFLLLHEMYIRHVFEYHWRV